MRPQKVQDEELLNGMMSVLRDKGYDGVSLNDLSRAAGLQKASLYHRFPGGKKEIGQALLAYIDLWLETNILSVIADETKPPEQRLSKVLDNINDIYEDGNKACLMKAVSGQIGLDLFGDELNSSMSKWIKGFTDLASAFGFDRPYAKKLGHQVLINIQGALIVSKGMDSNEYFTATIEHIKSLYLNK
tara:strand:+ start:729 stop:1292 length:564 start_codon:yes stop_codon:yes gene_type:complete